MAYIKHDWQLVTFHKGDAEVLKNLNQMEDGIAEGGGSSYTAGSGINISDNVISTKLGNGLKYSSEGSVEINSADNSIVSSESGISAKINTNSLNLGSEGIEVKVADESLLAVGAGTTGLKVNTDKIQPKLTAGDNIVINNDVVSVNEDLSIKSLTASATISANTDYFHVGPVYDGGSISSDKPSAISGKGLIALNLMSGKTLSAVGENVVIVGTGCYAREQSSVACGTNTQATASYSFSSGLNTEASKKCSFAGGRGSKADRENEFVVGLFNKYNIDYQLFVVGNGTGDSNRSNAFVVDTWGNATVSNTLTAVNLSDGTNSKTVTEILQNQIALPTTDGDYKLHIENGQASWVQI